MMTNKKPAAPRELPSYVNESRPGGPSHYIRLGHRMTRYEVIVLGPSPNSDLEHLVVLSPKRALMVLPRYWTKGVNDDYLMEKLEITGGDVEGIQLALDEVRAAWK